VRAASSYIQKLQELKPELRSRNPNFSACFGAPFMPLHPTKYAEMLSKKKKQQM
jgi:phosphoenolpyruvate carboxykinase (ATP)